MGTVQANQNPIAIKIRNGGNERADAGNLCTRCRNALVIHGVNNEHLIFCSAMRSSETPVQMRFDVARCSDYSDRNQVRLCDMEEIAWMLVTKKSGNAIGFVTPEAWQKVRTKEG